MDKYKVIRIHWIDSSTNPGWHDANELDTIVKSELPVIQSVGWLVFECETFVVIAQSVGTFTVGDLLKIPRATVKEMFIDNG